MHECWYVCLVYCGLLLYFLGEGGAPGRAKPEVPPTSGMVNLRAIAKLRERPSTNNHRNVPITFNLELDARGHPGIDGGDMDQNLGRFCWRGVCWVANTYTVREGVGGDGIYMSTEHCLFNPHKIHHAPQICVSWRQHR